MMDTQLDTQICDFCGKKQKLMQLVRQAQKWCGACTLPTERDIYSIRISDLKGVRLA
jgi:hypothetical protein